MRGRAQRQTWRLTSRELHKLTRDARNWLQEAWQAANEAARQDDPFGPQTEPVARDLADGSEARLSVIRHGCATRAVLVGPTEQPMHDRAWFGSPDRLPDTVRRIASEEFGEVMTLPDEVWQAYVASAAHEFQKTLVNSWRELPRDAVDELLRCGYVLRCVDEAFAR